LVSEMDSGLRYPVISECYGCAVQIPIQERTYIGEIFECPDCGLELELRLVDDNLGEVPHGPFFRSIYDGIEQQLTLAQAPMEGEDFGE